MAALITPFQEFAETLGVSSQQADPPEQDIETGNWLGAADKYLEQWQVVHRAAEQAQVRGLPELTGFVCSNAQGLVESCRAGRSEEDGIFTLAGLQPVLGDFLESPLDADRLGELISYLQQSGWPSPMDDEQAFRVMGQLLDQLQDVDFPDEEQVPPEADYDDRGPVADDFELTLPADTHPQLVDAFFNEVPQLAEEFTQCIQHLTGGAGSRADLLKAQRLSHTIKGSANITGVHGVATLMHGCEDRLESLYQRNAMPDGALCDVLMETADCLAAQLDHIQGEGPAPDGARELVNLLRQWQVGDAKADIAAQVALTPVSEPTQPDDLAAQEPDQERDPEPVQELDDGLEDKPVEGSRVETSGLPESLRVSSARIENLLRQAGEVSISTVQLLGLGQVLDTRLVTLAKQQAELWERLNTIQELVEVRSSSLVRHTTPDASPDGEFDALEMDEYNELYSATSFLAESIMDAREYTHQIRDDFNRMRSMLTQQDVLSRELSENVIGTRMVPFRSIGARLERVVRQTSRSTGKRAELSIEGGDVLVDRTVLDRLSDPLMHVLRNAVDHGLEETSERVAAGKPETGNIAIQVARHGDNVSLLIKDDGNGLDYAGIRRAGVQRGTIEHEWTTLSEEELARLILLPGFSTRSETTQISGRGIGMDVVNTAVIEQRGTMEIRSESGAGVEIHIRVPMTLISVQTLLLRIEGVVLGVPSSSVEQLIFSDLGQWRTNANGESIFEFEQREYQALSLASLIGIESSPPNLDGPKPLPLVLVQGERISYAVILQETLDHRYLVVKRLGRYVPRLPGVIGGSILGDGSVAAVIDLRELLRQYANVGAAGLYDIGQRTRIEAARDLPAVLVVDDSISTRRALSELVSDAGYRSETAIDGLDALAKIGEHKPAAILVDMEMPRMNGIELTAHLRADNATAAIPMIMITSRSADKHRRQATRAGVNSYFTKPYQEDDLVEQLRVLIG